MSAATENASPNEPHSGSTENKSSKLETAMHDYRLSKRGAYSSIHGGAWDSLEKALLNQWTPQTPDGTIMLALAENWLMHEEVEKYIEQHLKINPVRHLATGEGPKGSVRLRKALASFLNTNLKAFEKVQYSDLVINSGVNAAVDSIVWAICNEGDGVIVPRPLFPGFQGVVADKNVAKVIPASFQDIQGYNGLDDIFDPTMNKTALEKALEKATRDGVDSRAVIITNPHNPLGRCYPVDAIKEILRFCNDHNLHLISDEIYANSVFENTAAPGAVPFASVLSLDLSGIIDPRLVHVVYGASKDFCANGLRLGAAFSRNEGVLKSVANARPSVRPPYIIQDVWASMLEDDEWLTSFFARNQRAMADAFATMAGFFDKHEISYYKNTNAGLFIWVDLRKFLFPASSSAEMDFGSIKVTSPEAQIYKEREAMIGAICMNNGVMIGNGSGYAAEELGWFRITFTTSPDALLEGLKRIWRSLQEAQAEWS